MKVVSRIESLVPVPSEGSNVVVIARLEHKFASGEPAAGATPKALTEIVLVGDQPHQQGHPGPVKRLASPYRGVSFHSCTQRWRSRIKHGSKSEHLGYFCSDVEAAHAYNEAAKKIHGGNAQLNEGVELVITSHASVSTTVLNSTRVPYDGETVYVDQESKSKPRSISTVSPSTKQATAVKPIKARPQLSIQHPHQPSVRQHHHQQYHQHHQHESMHQYIKREQTQQAENPLDFFITAEEEPVSPCGNRLDFTAAVDQWDDLFLQYWFNDNGGPLGCFDGIDEKRCGMKRPSSFALVEAKRIRC